MATTCNQHFTAGLSIGLTNQLEPPDGGRKACYITLLETGRPGAVTMFFNRTEDMDTLIAALQDLRAKYAAADPAVVPLLPDPDDDDMRPTCKMCNTTEFKTLQHGLCERCRKTQFSRPLKPGETEPGVPPWPVAPGTDTTGWSDSQKLGEQPPEWTKEDQQRFVADEKAYMEDTTPTGWASNPDPPHFGASMAYYTCKKCNGKSFETLMDGLCRVCRTARERAVVDLNAPIELSPESVDPWKERGEVSDPSETPTDEIALPAPLPLCRSCNFMLISAAEVDRGLCDDCVKIAEKIQF